MPDTLLRGASLSFNAEPGPFSEDANAIAPGVSYIDDGVLSIQDGVFSAVESVASFTANGGDLAQCEDLRGGLLLPGFIDTHIHYPQMDIIAGYGSQLLDWLERYAFPAELAYADLGFAQAQAEVFMNRLFQHGTTTALTFTTVHAHTTDALLESAERHGARMIAGKVLMNRNAPEGLRDSGDGIAESAELIERWHNRGRMQYAVTPRFAITCTDDQMRAAGELLTEYPGTYLHTHLAEHPDEITATLELFPKAHDYVDVYDQFNMLTERSVFAHGIHLSNRELKALSAAQAGIAFCPTSNMFLGSGLLQLERLRENNVRLSVGSDVGGGTSFSMLSTIAEGYKVTQLNNETWHPFSALHAITRGNAHALGLGDKIGQLAQGFEADLTVLKPPAGSLLESRLAGGATLIERIFAAMFMGGNDAIDQTWVAGRKVFDRNLLTSPQEISP